MRILPTPQVFRQSGKPEPIRNLSPEFGSVTPDATVCWGITQLEEVCVVMPEGGEPLVLEWSDDPFFLEKNAAEQGYILRRGRDGIRLQAQNSAGFLYGLMTLRQLADTAPVEFYIQDRPQIRFRGNMNTLWAESGVWSYDFGDGLEAACARIRGAIDHAARAKLNLMYLDGFGFRPERFPGYNRIMQELAAYGKTRCVRMMAGGYGMGYGSSEFGNTFMGRSFRNRMPYPDGEIYDCLGTYKPEELGEQMLGRSFGTCLSNDALTDDKIADLREYLRATGISVVYMHNMDADQLFAPLWLGRCSHCKARFPSDALDAPDGAAGAFAAFYDRILDALLPEFPDLVICPVSPGYGLPETMTDIAFENSRIFWAAVLRYCRNRDALIPTFRELFCQREEPSLRYDLLHEKLSRFGSVYFSGADGFYSDQIYTPSAAYIAAMQHADLIVCANGEALQRPIWYTNAEYLWNPTGSAFWNAEIPRSYEAQMAHYDALRQGRLRPDGLYGPEGLLETSCALAYGKNLAKPMADLFRLQGKNGEHPIFTASNVELWTNSSILNYPMLWDTPAERPQQLQYRERFAESAAVTAAAEEILTQVLKEESLCAEVRAHLEFMHFSSIFCGQLCSQLARYMDLYIAADQVLTEGKAQPAELTAQCHALIQDAKASLRQTEQDGRVPFDPLGGILRRRGELFAFVAYCAGQIVQSLQTGERIPPQRRPLQVGAWW